MVTFVLVCFFPSSLPCFYLCLSYKLPQIIQSPLICMVATSVAIMANLLEMPSDLPGLSIKILVLPDWLVQFAQSFYAKFSLVQFISPSSFFLSSS